MGDEVDGVPGIQHLVPSFGRKTALKLLKKHGSLENLLNAAAVRTVGRQYAQEALTKYADYLRRNYEVLALRRFCFFLLSTMVSCSESPYGLLFLNYRWFPISIVHPTYHTGTLMFIFKKNGWLKGTHAMIQVFYLTSSDCWKILIKPTRESSSDFSNG